MYSKWEVMHRAINSFLRFELLDKCSKARGDGAAIAPY
jgi:hypothetical protein